MNALLNNRKFRIRIPKGLIILSVCWVIVIGGFLLWEINNQKRSIYEFAAVEARANFNKDLLYRRWSASHGGTYVPITNETPPNPYLSHLDERDISTPSGKKLTLVNPAYMTRQVYELSKRQYGVRGHITSLKPLRPENKPDKWEIEALKAFERGKEEIKSVSLIDQVEYLRLMRPMITEKRCLKCHARQGYKERDLRGGISISVPLTPYRSIADKNIRRSIFRHLFIMIIGLMGLGLGGILLHRRETDRYAASKALRQSERRLNEAQDVAHVANWERNFKTGEGYWSDEQYRLLGYEPNEISNSHEIFLKHLHPDDKLKVVEALENSLSSGEDFEIDARYIPKNGKLRYAHIICNVEPDQKSKPRWMHGTFQDITVRKKVENELMKKTHDIRERIKELKCLYSISTLHENRDISMDEIFQSIANAIPPAWQYPEITCAQIIINNKNYKTDNFKVGEWKQFSNILVYEQKVGTVEVYYSKGMPRIDEGPFLKEERSLINEIAERISRFIERKQSEKNSIKFETQLRQAQKMEAIGTLAGGIAHDFNNILFPILGHTEMLLSEDMPEVSPLRNSLGEIYAGTLRAKDLVNQILTFSRQATNELILMKMPPIIKEALKLIRSTIPTTIDIKQDISNDCGIIKADPTQIHQVVMNLTTNAYHAMEDTGGELKVSLKEIELSEYDIIYPNMTPGDYACLIVSDTGIGMDKDLTKKIFDPFFTTKENGKGTGMGLSVVYGIVNGMGGAIQVYSEPGKGTEFKVYFPVEKSSFKKQNTQIEEPIQRGTEQILLVDDEEAILTMGKQMLERLGYKVTSRISSIEALEAFRFNPDKFDLIITDMAMPYMSGDKLAVELIKTRPDIRILLCTGFSENLPREKAASIGIKDFLMKPIVMKELAQKIREVLDKN